MTGPAAPDPDWFRERARTHRSTHGDRCQGTVSLIDPAARLRGVAAVRTGEAIPLGRPIAAAPAVRDGEARPTAQIEVFLETAGGRTVGTDRVTLDPHGTPNTHLDGLAHFGVDDEWHDGRPCSSLLEGDGTLAAWARHGLTTRAVLADVPAHRGTEWVTADAPVTADDIQGSLAATGAELMPGDALLLYMGRDRYEAAGHELLPIARSGRERPGVGRSAAEWIADHGVSVLCWDFLDAHGPGLEPLVVHHLIWAIGLALVDSCDLGAAAEALRGRQPPTGLLTVAPLALDRATGCMVNPLLLV